MAYLTWYSFDIFSCWCSISFVSMLVHLCCSIWTLFPMWSIILHHVHVGRSLSFLLLILKRAYKKVITKKGKVEEIRRLQVWFTIKQMFKTNMIHKFSSNKLQKTNQLNSPLLTKHHNNIMPPKSIFSNYCHIFIFHVETSAFFMLILIPAQQRQKKVRSSIFDSNSGNVIFKVNYKSLIICMIYS